MTDKVLFGSFNITGAEDLDWDPWRNIDRDPIPGGDPIDEPPPPPPGGWPPDDPAPDAPDTPARVTLEDPHGDQVTLYVTNGDFVTEAKRLEGSDEIRVPLFDIYQDEGNPQGWNVKPDTAKWGDLAMEVCDARIADVPKLFTLNPDWQNPRWCPWRDKVIDVEDVG